VLDDFDFAMIDSFHLCFDCFDAVSVVLVKLLFPIVPSNRQFGLTGAALGVLHDGGGFRFVGDRHPPVKRP
jgi:hypothetical protein